MLENARSQVFLVLLSIVAGLTCCLWLRPNYGPDLKGGTQLTFYVPDDNLEALLKRDSKSTRDKVMDQTVSIIHDRIDPTGVLDALVTRSGPQNILIELPYIDNPLERARIVDQIKSMGLLEMRMVAYEDYAGTKFDLAKERERLETWLKNGGRDLVKDKDKARNIRSFNEDQVNGPLAFGKLAWYPHIIRPSTRPGQENMWTGTFVKNEKLAAATVKVYDDTEFNNGTVPAAQPGKEAPKELLEYVAVNLHEMYFTGDNLDPAGVTAGFGQDGGPAVNYKIRDDRTSDYAKWSETYIGKCSAIILNGEIKSAPFFQGRIPGNGQIHGDFTQTEVEDLIKVLRTGSLRVEPEIQSHRDIGPTLGADAINNGIISLVAGGVAVFAFMLIYYRMSGVIACATLVLNVFLLWAAMLFMKATITLPGLGGIVLSMGMAVDANILIYERIREELHKGKDLLRSVRAGFDRAMVVIVDANVTHFLSGLILYNVGVGPVRGFAVTLMLGIFTTLFTQFFVTRLLFHFALGSGRMTEFKAMSVFKHDLKFDFVKYIKPAIIGSTLVSILGVVYACFVPTEKLFSMDFTGGANLQMMVRTPMSAEEVRTALEKDAKFASDYQHPAVNTVEAGPDGRAVQFNVRVKLKDAQRQRIEQERSEWRLHRNDPDHKDKSYKPPYVEHLERIFADRLGSRAFTGTSIDEVPGGAFAHTTVHFTRPVELAAVTKTLQAAKLPQSQVSAPADPAATEAMDVLIEWSAKPGTPERELHDAIRHSLESLQGADKKPMRLSDPFPEAEEIQGRLVGELRNAAIGALILSWLAIMFYLRVRFHEYSYGIGAVVALVHDVLITFGLVVICNHLGLVHAEIGLSMIACFLTIIGYSVNDTIVVYDRIRENLHENQRLGLVEKFPDLINRSINQTLGRTVLTSGVTMFCVLAQFVVNIGSGSDLESFAFGFVLGIITGTYSSIYVSAPILIWMRKDDPTALPTARAATPAKA